jgi:hypothetical protein
MTAAPLAWGAKVSPAFRAKVRAIAAMLPTDPSDLMACMAWESGRSFRPDVRNMAGSGAVGLIQFMPTVAGELGTSAEALAAMPAEAQLDYVERYFAMWKRRLAPGKAFSLEDLYMAILWPVAVGKPDTFVLFDVHDLEHPARYRQNAGLDINHDGLVTKAEACVKVLAIRAEGLRPLSVA